MKKKETRVKTQKAKTRSPGYNKDLHPPAKSRPGDDLTEVQPEELSGSPKNNDLSVSDTDENEDEALGNGNIKRSDEDPLG